MQGLFFKLLILAVCPTLALLQATSLTTVSTLSTCASNQIMSSIGCIKSCSHSDFDNCPPFSTLIYNPQYCALTNKNSWVNFTTACQACKTDGIVGIDAKPCNCEHLGCPANFKCNTNKQCIQQITCANILCPAGSTCVLNQCVQSPDLVLRFDPCDSANCLLPLERCSNGQCYPANELCNGALCRDGQVCRSSKCVQNIECSNQYTASPDAFCPRPFNQICPEILLIPGAVPTYCGVNRQGELKGYYLECHVCRDVSIVSYFKHSCEQVLTCPPSKICSNKKCIQCSADQNCPFLTQKCVQNLCTPTINATELNCENILCSAQQTCVLSQCVPLKSQGNIIDSCAGILCFKGNYCELGKCVQIKTLNPCANVSCSNNSLCIDGGCVEPPVVLPVPVPPPKTPTTGKKCNSLFIVSPNALCRGQVLTESCQALENNAQPKFCGVNKMGDLVNFTYLCQICRDRNMVSYFNRPCPQLPVCPRGQKCINSSCLECAQDSDCNGQSAKCTGNKCSSNTLAQISCLNILCVGNLTCVLNQCVPLQINQSIPNGTIPNGTIPNGTIPNGTLPTLPQPDSLCAKKACFYGCRDGACFECLRNIDCGDRYQCIANKCSKIDLCKQVTCKEYEKCQEGQCVRDTFRFGTCTNNQDCLSYEICFGRRCYDRCFLMLCAGCYRGVCGAFPIK